MLSFLQENARSIFAMVFMAIWWASIGFISIKGDIKTLNQKRIAKGMTAMTEDEELLMKQTLRLSNANNLLSVLVAGIVAIIIMHLF